VIKSSWSRCQQSYGFDRGDKINAIIIPEHELKIHQEACEDISEVAGKVVNSVRHLAKNGDYSVLLTDNQCVTIDSYFDSPESEICADYGLISGSKWDEHLIGTNGIGTTFASQQCMTINGIDHYANCLSNFTCTAAPIYGEVGTILGSLNISRFAHEDYLESFFTHNFIREAASQISANLFLKRYKTQNVISLSPSSLLSLYESKALIAFNDEGIILDATQDCLDMLSNMRIEDLLGKHFTHIFPLQERDLYSSQSQPLLLREGIFKNIYIKGIRTHKKSRAKQKEDHKELKVKTKKQPACQQLDDFAGTDKAMQRVVKIGRQFIDQGLPLLILGETGVGKDTFTSLLHKQSQRADKPFIAVNCAAIPESLMDSELFGYKPGTFTDGLKDGKIGKILASHEGILFLDEIGDMPLTLQARLLRVLEEREVTQLGAITPTPVDTCIICATHKNISELVEQGKFRQDLYFRIKGVQIEIPPLRDRTNIDEITTSIIKLSTDHNPDDITIQPDVRDLLKDYDWPGNVRELKSTLLYALCLSNNKTITLNDLPKELLQSSSQPSDTDEIDEIIPQQNSSDEDRPKLIKLEASSNKAEVDHIILILKRNKWNVSASAKQLGISRSTLHRKIQKHEIMAPNKTISKPQMQNN